MVISWVCALPLKQLQDTRAVGRITLLFQITSKLNWITTLINYCKRSTITYEANFVNMKTFEEKCSTTSLTTIVVTFAHSRGGISILPCHSTLLNLYVDTHTKLQDRFHMRILTQLTIQFENKLIKLYLHSMFLYYTIVLLRTQKNDKAELQNYKLVVSCS